MAAQRIITLTTDFGNADHFVGTMRGVILGINPAAMVVDLCNSVSSFDILDGALTLAEGYKYFPSETIHLVVVDPGVGSSRRPLLAVTSRHYFICPDNGILSLVLAQEERFTVYCITAEHYYLQPVSKTFHGRDIFAPCAAWLSKGVDAERLGEPVTDYVRFNLPQPKPVAEGMLRGVVLKADKFGNLMTNFNAANSPALFAEGAKPRIKVAEAAVSGLRAAYTEGQPGELIALVNSMGYLEIACNKAAASQVAKAGRGAPVTVEL